MEEDKMSKVREEELQDVTGGSSTGPGHPLFGIGVRVVLKPHLEYGVGIIKDYADVQDGWYIDDVTFDKIGQTIRCDERQLAQM